MTEQIQSSRVLTAHLVQILQVVNPVVNHEVDPRSGKHVELSAIILQLPPSEKLGGHHRRMGIQQLHRRYTKRYTKINSVHSVDVDTDDFKNEINTEGLGSQSYLVLLRLRQHVSAEEALPRMVVGNGEPIRESPVNRGISKERCRFRRRRVFHVVSNGDKVVLLLDGAAELKVYQA